MPLRNTRKSIFRPRDLGTDDVYPHPSPEATSEAREDLRDSLPHSTLLQQLLHFAQRIPALLQFK